MAITLGSVIDEVRMSDPAFGRETVPDRVLGQALGRIQRRLSLAAHEVNSTYLATVLPIVFDLDSGNIPGTAGAGTTGGLPATTDAAGNITVLERTLGNVVEFNPDDAPVILNDFVPTSVTASTMTLTGAGRAVNGDAGYYIHVVSGPGSGEESLRIIASNTATVWTITGSWDSLPSTASVVRIVNATAAVGQTMGSVTGLPGIHGETGYLVRQNSAGVAYIDLTKPLVARVTSGIPLPPFQRLLGGTVYMVRTNAPLLPADTPEQRNPGQVPFRLIDFQGRHSVPVFPSGYTLGGELYLVGDNSDWRAISSIDLRYIPIPLLFPTDQTAMSSLFLLHDTAFDVLVAEANLRAARFATGKGLQTVDVQSYVTEASECRALWIQAVARQKSGAIRQSLRNR